MRIGIDARMYRSGVAGIGRYSKNLIKNLLMLDKENEYILFMTPDDWKEFQSLNPKSEARNPKQIQNYKIIQTNIAHFSLAEQTKLPKILGKEKLDLMHFLNFNHPIRYKGKFIIVIHDLTLYLYPETAKSNNIIKQTVFKNVLKRGCQNAQKIIAVSENTKKDIMKFFNIESNKIKVIYEAADDPTSPTGLRLQACGASKNVINKLKNQYNIQDKPVILCVSQFRPHKNLVGLVKAFNRLRRSTECKLAILGQVDKGHVSLLNEIEKSEFRSDIFMPGFVSDKELAMWYSLSTLFVFPSLYEGFGLPGLEAMASGTPVVASNTSSLPEIYKDAAVYFDPFSFEDISDKIKIVLEDDKLRMQLVKKGKIVAANYTWKKTALETIKIYKSVINSDS